MPMTTVTSALARDDGAAAAGAGAKSLRASAHGMTALEEGADVEEVSQDLSAMSREEKLQVLMSDAPELVELLQSFKDGRSAPRC